MDKVKIDVDFLDKPTVASVVSKIKTLAQMNPLIFVLEVQLFVINYWPSLLRNYLKMSGSSMDPGNDSCGRLMI